LSEVEIDSNSAVICVLDHGLDFYDRLFDCFVLFNYVVLVDEVFYDILCSYFLQLNMPLIQQFLINMNLLISTFLHFQISFP
jgi:hypothetical protein